MSTLLQVNNLKKSYSGDVIFNNLSLSISQKQKIGVIGRNGAGKSTLFKMILGLEEIDGGSVTIYENTNIGYLSQHSEKLNLEDNVIDFLIKSTGKQEWQCAKLAGDFQIKKEMLHKKIGSFAGGYQMRIKLIELLLHEPNLLLLDEPTNFLDLSTLLLLEQFLIKYTGSFLLISHDREFIKKTCKQTIEIEAGKAIYFPNNIERYFEHKKEQLQLARRYNKKIQKEQRHLEDFVNRFRSKASKASQAQSKLKQLNKLKTIQIAIPAGTTKITIPKVNQKGGTALDVTDLIIGYGDKIIAQDINLDIERGEHWAIVGNNGQGKTTLLKTVAGELEKLGGTFRWGPKINIGYYAQHVPQMLPQKEQILTYLQSMADSEVQDEAILKMAGNFLFKDHDLKKSVSVLSGGEKARLCLAGLLLQKNHVLLLDEPTNHLDFETVEALGEALKTSNATIIFISHNRTFVNQVADGIIIVSNKKVIKSYHDYEHYVSSLKQELDIKEPQPEEKLELEIDLDAELRVERKLLYGDIKQEKRKIEKFEEEMEKLNKIKTRLNNWFLKHPTEYSAGRVKEMGEVTERISEIEEEWFDVQENIGKLEWILSEKQKN